MKKKITKIIISSALMLILMMSAAVSSFAVTRYTAPNTPTGFTLKNTCDDNSQTEVTASWNKVNGENVKYEVMWKYTRSGQWTEKSTSKVSKTKAVKVWLKKNNCAKSTVEMKARVRAYREINGQVIYSEWSSWKTLKITGKYTGATRD